MDQLRERFLRVYANIPLNLRDEVISVIEHSGIRKPISWDVAYIEIKAKTDFSKIILKELEKLELI